MKLWNHWSRRGDLEIAVLHADFDIPYVGRYEESDYAQRLRNLVHALDESPQDVMVHQDLAVFDETYHELKRFGYLGKE